MAITYPFDVVAKYGNPVKITAQQEHDMWINMRDTINDLATRCNTKNATALAAITITTSITKGAALTAAEYDANLTAVETRLNQIIAASSAQGMTPSNTFTLHKRTGRTEPLLTYHRDTNMSTVQIVINTINNLYNWS